MTDETTATDDRRGIGCMEVSPTIGKIAGALAKSAAALGAVRKTHSAKLGTYSYTYATLADAIEACQEALAANGIAVLQAPAAGRGIVTVTTTLAHESGEWISCSLDMPVGEARAQAVGSAITYARRYSLMALVGLAADDDDGRAADDAARARSPQQPPPPARPTPEKRNPVPAAPAVSRPPSATELAIDVRERMSAAESAKDVIDLADAWVAEHAKAPEALRARVAAYARYRAADISGGEVPDDVRALAVDLAALRGRARDGAA